VPSMPGAPRLAFTRFHARRKFTGSRTRTIKSSCKAGCVRPRRAPSPPLGFGDGCESLTAPPFFCVRPFTVRPSGTTRLLWPPLTSARSRPALPQNALPKTGRRVRWRICGFRRRPQSGSHNLPRPHAGQTFLFRFPASQKSPASASCLCIRSSASHPRIRT
jgi:hypothetical protein